MPVFDVIVDERYPDFDLRPSDGYVGTERIELSEAEFTEFKRVSAAYSAWIDRIEALTRTS